jgi:ABC-type nitrate/sulfonate/bicarbonate transport system substrate-binding protein
MPRPSASARLRSVIVGAAAALALVGTAQADDTLRVGKVNPTAFSFVPLDVGIQTGIFAKHGLKIDQTVFAGSAKLHQAISAKGIDIGLGSGPELAFITKGAPELGVAAMAGPPRLLALVVRKDGDIHSVADLKGKTISVSTVGSLTQWLVSELQRRQGWPTDTIKITPLGAGSAQVAALRAGQIDGASIDLATAYSLEEAGAVRIVLKWGDVVPDFIIHVIYASNDIMNDKPDAVRRFLAGWFETIAYMRAHKTETVAIAQKVMGSSAEISSRVYDELMPMFSDTGKFEPKALKLLSTSFVELGTLDKQPDLTKTFTEKFLPSAGR